MFFIQGQVYLNERVRMDALGGGFKRADVLPCLNTAWSEMMNLKNIKSAWRDIGVDPWNPELVLAKCPIPKHMSSTSSEIKRPTRQSSREDEFNSCKTLAEFQAVVDTMSSTELKAINVKDMVLFNVTTSDSLEQLLYSASRPDQEVGVFNSGRRYYEVVRREWVVLGNTGG